MKLVLQNLGPLTLALSLVAPAVLTQGAVLAQGTSLSQKSDLKRALPAGTIVFVSMPDIDASVAEMGSTPLAKIWHEEEVQAFFADAQKMVKKEWEKALVKAREAHEAGMLPFKPEDLLKLRVHGMTAAVTGIKVDVGDQGMPSPDIGMMLHVDFGDSVTQWRSILDFGLTQLEAQAMGMLVKNETKVGEVALVEYAPQVSGTAMSLNLAWIGNGLLFGTRNKEVKSAIEVMTGKAPEALTASEAYKATAKNLTMQGAEVEVFAQPTLAIDALLGILELAAEHAPEFPAELKVDGVKRVVDALGLRSIKAVGMTSAYEQGRAVSKSFSLSPAPERMGLFAGSTKELGMGFLKWVPKDAVSFGAMTMDFPALYDGLLGAVKAYDQEFAKHVDQMIAGYEQQIGFSVKEDLFGALGNEVITWSMPMAAMIQAPELAVLVQVRDEQKLMKTLTALAKLSEGIVELDQVERQGVKMNVLRITIDPTGGAGMNPLASIVPTFAFKNGYMAMGLTTGFVKRTLDRMDRQDEPKGDIRGNAEFAGCSTRLPKAGLNSISFTDWKPQFESFYQLLTTALALVPIDTAQVPIDMSLLPDVSSLTKHLFGSASWSMSDGTGFTTYGEGPFGPELAAMVGCGIGIAAGLAPRVMQERAAAARPRVRVKPPEDTATEPGSKPATDPKKGEDQPKKNGK